MKKYFWLASILFLLVAQSCKEDECEDVTCRNGGTCVNGDCDCPPGFSGPDCSNLETPDVIRINSIKLLRFPQTEPDGGGWDLTSGPDIYVEVGRGSSSLLETGFFQNALISQTYEWDVSPALVITEPNLNHYIDLLDFDDFDADDFMGGINFTPFDPARGFPNPIVIDVSSEVAFELDVEYVW
jgi:hypothetical protein